MLLFWRKNKLKVKAIRHYKDNRINYTYLPISNLLEKLNKVNEEFPKVFRYEVKEYSKAVPNYAEGTSILLYYKDKEFFYTLQNNLVIEYSGQYDFTFNCGRYEWEVL